MENRITDRSDSCATIESITRLPINIPILEKHFYSPIKRCYMQHRFIDAWRFRLAIHTLLMYSLRQHIFLNAFPQPHSIEIECKKYDSRPKSVEWSVHAARSFLNTIPNIFGVCSPPAWLANVCMWQDNLIDSPYTSDWYFPFFFLLHFYFVVDAFGQLMIFVKLAWPLTSFIF